MVVVAAVVFGLLEIAAAVSPSFWLFALLLVPIGMFGLTVNITANSAVQLATDPVMRGRVMSLYMMVFAGGTPIGAPLLGWITDTYGPRVGFATGGLVSLAAAGVVGLVLARVGGLKMAFGWHHGHPQVRFVERDRLATAA